MPRFDLDRDTYLKEIDRRHRWAWRVARLRHALGALQRPVQAEAYDRTFRSDLEAVTYYYAARNSHMPDLESPRWVNEKVRWQFLNHPNPLMTLAADKAAVRSYLRFKGAEIPAPELYGVFSSGEEMLSARLPRRFVLKSTFGCGQHHFIDEVEPVRRRALASQLRRIGEWDHWRVLGEMHYRGIPKRWLAEEDVGPVESITEYKFYCLHGQPVFVLYISERGPGRFRHALFDLNWGPVDFHWNGHPETAERPRRPADFERMVAEAKRLSEDFLHVRVDFLQQGNRTYFSELTFSGGGARNAFVPHFHNEVLGDMLDLGHANAYLERGRRVVQALSGAGRQPVAPGRVQWA